MNDTNLTTVFGQLSNLARRLDHGVVEIQEKINEPKIYSDDDECYVNANRHLQNTKKEICALKDDAKDQLCVLQLNNCKFQQILSLLPKVISHQRKQLNGIEEYLRQYGYETKEKKTDNAESEATTDNLVSSEGDEENGDDCDDGGEPTKSTGVEPSTPDEPRLKATMCKTPQLEDFGISDLTMNFLKKGVQYQHPKASSVDNSYQCTPTIFKHKGIFVTPSLMNEKSALMPKYESDFNIHQSNFNAAVSHHAPSGNLTPAAWGERIAGPLQSVHMSTVGPTDSPEPPRFLTPGAKQINKKLYIEETRNSVEDIDSPIPPLLMTPGIKQICKHAVKPVKQGSDVTVSFESPTMPTFLTPGAKQFQKNMHAPQAPSLRSRSVWDKEPEIPELTMSFKDVPRQKQSFLHNQFYSSHGNRSPEPPAARSAPTKGASTPPMPDLMTGSLSGVTPPAPMLLGKYAFFSGRENVPP